MKTRYVILIAVAVMFVSSCDSVVTEPEADTETNTANEDLMREDPSNGPYEYAYYMTGVRWGKDISQSDEWTKFNHVDTSADGYKTYTHNDYSDDYTSHSIKGNYLG